MKYCPGCDKKKPVVEFSRDSRKKDGRQTYCKLCQKVRRPSGEAENARLRAYRAKNREAARAVCKRQYHKNRDKRIAQMAAYRGGGRGYAAVKRWREKNPEASKVLNQNRRAREAAAVGSFTRAEWTAKCGEFANRCAYCRKRRKLTIHHVEPLSKGGSNYIDNVVPACGSCNSSIGTKTVYPEVCHY